MVKDQIDRAIGGVFRELHQGDSAFIMPHPRDIGTARLLVSIGFNALAIASAGLAIVLGRPEGRTNTGDGLAH